MKKDEECLGLGRLSLVLAVGTSIIAMGCASRGLWTHWMINGLSFGIFAGCSLTAYNYAYRNRR